MCELCDLEGAAAVVRAAGHRAESEWFWMEAATLQRRWSVLGHPFYARWTAGELTSREIQVYAEEYDHLVVALAVASRNAARKSGGGLLGEKLDAHAAEEHAHVDLWREFAKASGWRPRYGWYYGEDPYPGTVECARIWAGGLSRGRWAATW